MTERLADITARIGGIRKVGSVVNALRGIAAARAQQARTQLAAVDSYAEIVAFAIARILPLPRGATETSGKRGRPPALIAFLAEEGFAGAFSERILDTIGRDFDAENLFIVGTRGAGLARERETAAVSTNMPSHPSGVPALADRLTRELYERFASGTIDTLDVVFTTTQPGEKPQIVRKRLFPVNLATIPNAADGNIPLLNLPAEAVLAALLEDYVHALLCHAALHAFAAESEARLVAMSSTRSHIEDMLGSLQTAQNIARQEEITAEIIELAASESVSHEVRLRT